MPKGKRMELTRQNIGVLKSLLGRECLEADISCLIFIYDKWTDVESLQFMGAGSPLSEAFVSDDAIRRSIYELAAKMRCPAVQTSGSSSGEDYPVKSNENRMHITL